jgi:hypothetical protein
MSFSLGVVYIVATRWSAQITSFSVVLVAESSFSLSRQLAQPADIPFWEC